MLPAGSGTISAQVEQVTTVSGGAWGPVDLAVEAAAVFQGPWRHAIALQ
ncbi:MAG: hypothetical protein AAGF12_11380 [Myxococcota bacterium]